MSEKKDLKKSKKVKTIKQTGLVNPVLSSFGKKSQILGREEISPKSTFNPVGERSGVRGDR